VKVKIKGPNENGIMMIDRDGFPLGCPRNTEWFCSNTCPAFTHHPKTGNDPEFVELKCFPNEVKFEVEDEK